MFRGSAAIICVSSASAQLLPVLVGCQPLRKGWVCREFRQGGYKEALAPGVVLTCPLSA